MYTTTSRSGRWRQNARLTKRHPTKTVSLHTNIAEHKQDYSCNESAARGKHANKRNKERRARESHASERLPASSPCGPCCGHRGGGGRGWRGRRRADRRKPRPETRSRRLPPAPTISSRGAHLERKSKRNPSSRTLIGLQYPGNGGGRWGRWNDDHGFSRYCQEALGVTCA